MSSLAAIHVGLKQLRIEEEDARDIYMRQTGVRSLREMSPRQIESVIAELRRLGFNPTASKAVGKRLEGPYAKKLQALWISAWNLGIVNDRTDAAMLAFVKRQTGIDHVRFLLHAADARKAVEALKAWIAREAGVDWTRDHGRKWLAGEQGKIAWAQFGKLVPGATLMGNERMFAETVGRIFGQAAAELPALSLLKWRAVMNELGKRIRKAKKL